tara:strand:- start:1573 stop:1737 length:165 start_codon:yes stop_codon:yes gene_type:complete
MRLTRQHFELIANVVAEADVTEAQREKLAVRFMYEFNKTNPNFKADRFLKACGV